MTGRARRRTAAAGASLALLLVGVGGLAGCSSDDGDAAPSSSAVTLPDSTGDQCTDPTGDLDLPVGVAADTPGLSGIDLVESSATVNGDQLDISITTAGPMEGLAATYVVAQGDPLGALSFELRMVHGDDGWSSTLVTWPGGKEQRQKVAVTPVASGSTLTASIPTSSLPAVALAMQFGASGEVGGQLVIDDCSSLTGG